MKITIIHKPDCPLCELAIREFAGDGHDIELHESLGEIKDIGRRAEMMTDMLKCDGDKNVFPQVFIYDRFTPWKPKTNRKGD